MFFGTPYTNSYIQASICLYLMPDIYPRRSIEKNVLICLEVTRETKLEAGSLTVKKFRWCESAILLTLPFSLISLLTLDFRLLYSGSRVETLQHGQTVTLPHFLEEPVDAYIIKSNPIKLRCQARPALQIFFKCNGEWVHQSQHMSQEHTDLGTGIVDADLQYILHRADLRN